MRYLLLSLAFALAACDSTPTELLMDEAPEVTETDPDAPPAEGFSVIGRGQLSGQNGYRVTGDVVVYRHTNGQHIVRVEGMNAQGGPDLKVWLVKRLAGDVTDGHFSLGPLRSTRGDQNYTVPAGTDPTEFAGLSVWCEQFGVGFGRAAITF